MAEHLGVFDHRTSLDWDFSLLHQPVSDAFFHGVWRKTAQDNMNIFEKVWSFSKQFALYIACKLLEAEWFLLVSVVWVSALGQRCLKESQKVALANRLSLTKYTIHGSIAWTKLPFQPSLTIYRHSVSKIFNLIRSNDISMTYNEISLTTQKTQPEDARK